MRGQEGGSQASCLSSSLWAAVGRIGLLYLNSQLSLLTWWWVELPGVAPPLGLYHHLDTPITHLDLCKRFLPETLFQMTCDRGET